MTSRRTPPPGASVEALVRDAQHAERAGRRAEARPLGRARVVDHWPAVARHAETAGGAGWTLLAARSREALARRGPGALARARPRVELAS